MLEMRMPYLERTAAEPPDAYVADALVELDEGSDAGSAGFGFAFTWGDRFRRFDHYVLALAQTFGHVVGEFVVQPDALSLLVLVAILSGTELLRDPAFPDFDLEFGRRNGDTLDAQVAAVLEEFDRWTILRHDLVSLGIRIESALLEMPFSPANCDTSRWIAALAFEDAAHSTFVEDVADAEFVGVVDPL
jgi:hypothetical protein